MRKLLLSTAGLLALGTAAAHAAPMISVEAADLTANQMLITGTTPGATSTNGNLATSAVGSGATAGDVVNITAQGIPINTGLATTTLDATGKAGTTLSIIVTETGLTAAQASIPFMVSFTLNALAGGASGSASFVDYVSTTNAQAFDTSSADQLRSVTLNGSSVASADNSIDTVSGLTVGSPYSVTQVINITFGTAGSISASSQILPASTTVPEPASMALLGAGLFGVGMVRRRGRRQG